MYTHNGLYVYTYMYLIFGSMYRPLFVVRLEDNAPLLADVRKERGGTKGVTMKTIPCCI